MLIEHIKDKYKRISIVGMSKNSGKTVALNYLIGEAYDQGIKIGITSIGRDGESIDIVTDTDKPPIFVEEGTLIATSTKMIQLGDANIEILRVTEYRTPLGEIIIGRVRDSGYVQIAGPQLLSEIKSVTDMMLHFGAEVVIIDGALDRLSQAAPDISEAAILSVGAVLSRDINKVIEQAIHVRNTLGLKRVDDEKIRDISRDLMYDNKIAVIDEEGGVDIIPLKTALGSGHIIAEHLRDNSKYLVISGSLSKNTLQDITRTTRRYKDIEIIIKDGTRVFIEPKDWLMFIRLGIKIRVLDSINLVGITLNPYAPTGYYFEPEEFLSKMRSYIKDIPVVDLVLGGD